MKRAGTSIGMVMVAVTAGIIVSCAGSPQAEPLPGAREGVRFAISLEPGPEYAKRVGFPFSYTVWPQVAVWIETTDGAYVDTLYVTARGERGAWRSAPKEGRPEALPVWSRLRSESADAVSAATTVGGTVSYGNDLAARLPAGRYVIMLETNRSYDWNQRYTRKNAGVNGQPSIVYRAELVVGGGRDEATFLPVGTGSVDGSDGDIRSGLEGIDTALSLFASLRVSFEID